MLSPATATTSLPVNPVLVHYSAQLNSKLDTFSSDIHILCSLLQSLDCLSGSCLRSRFSSNSFDITHLSFMASIVFSVSNFQCLFLQAL
jgi:hypothetical protein